MNSESFEYLAERVDNQISYFDQGAIKNQKNYRRLNRLSKYLFAPGTFIWFGRLAGGYFEAGGLLGYTLDCCTPRPGRRLNTA